MVIPGLDASPSDPRTTAAMLTLSDYSVSRGAFLDPPLLSLAVSFGSVVPSPLDVRWSAISAPGWSLFDPIDAGLLWQACGDSSPLVLSTEVSLVSEKIPDMRGDVGSTREFTVARTDPGAWWQVPVQSPSCWAVLALRTPEMRDNGPVLTLAGWPVDTVVRAQAGVWQLCIDDVVAVTLPRHASDAQVSVIAVSVVGARITGVIREGRIIYPFSTVIATVDPAVVTEIGPGGLGSPEMLVYAFALGTDDQMLTAFDDIVGMLS